MHRPSFLLASLAFLVTITCVVSSSPQFSSAVPKGTVATLTGEEINYTKIQSHVRNLSSFPTRVTGYPEYYLATEYIRDQFESIGVHVELVPYTTVVPLSKGTWVFAESSGLNVTAHPAWPNDMCASPANNMEGRLYYVEDGSLESMKGISVEGSILLMDFNSRKNWLEAANLGAKAVIFVEPPETNKYEAFDKAVAAPLNFPRLYVDDTSGAQLKSLKDGTMVVVNSKIVWEKVVAYNIMAVLEGKQEDDVVVLSAHYDSWSVVPSVSPSAEDAIGTATLIELARYFKANQPQKTIWFVAYSGHYQGLIGPAEWVETVLMKTSKQIWFQMALDLSSDWPAVDLLHVSQYIVGSQQAPGVWGRINPYEMTILSQPINFAFSDQFAHEFDWIQDLIDDYLTEAEGLISEKMKDLTIKPQRVLNYNIKSTFWWGTQPDSYMLDTEPMITAGSLAFTVRTQYARRPGFFTPLNDYEQMNWENVRPQILLSFIMVKGLTSEEAYEATFKSPSQLTIAQAGVTGTLTLSVQVVEFDFDIGWYVPISEALVRVDTFKDRDSPVLWPFSYRLGFSDENGTAVFHALMPWSTQTADAWKFDQNGNVVYALDRGFYGTAAGASGGLKDSIYPMQTTASLMIPLFRCTSVTLFNLIDTVTMMRTRVPDLRSGVHDYQITGNVLNIYDHDTKSILVFYSTYSMWEGVGVFFVKPDTKVTITFSTSPATMPVMILSNSTEDNPEGFGYRITEPMVIHKTTYEVMNSMYYLVKGRYARLQKSWIRSNVAEDMLMRAEARLKSANSSFQEKDYSAAFNSIALSLVRNAYSLSVMPLYGEASSSLMFFSFLIIPFSVLFQTLVMPKIGGVRKIIALAITIVLFFALFSFVHPSFSLMSNSVMAILGTGILLMSLIISIFFYKDISDIIKEYTLTQLGTHTVKEESVSVAIHTLTTAVENMRRRPIITTMMFITIIIFTAAQTSLTSTSYTYVVPAALNPRAAPEYDGIVVKNGWGFPPVTYGGVLDENFLAYLEGFAGERFIACPRVWWYPTPTEGEGNHLVLSSETKTVTRYPFAFLGLSSKDVEMNLPTLDGFSTPMDTDFQGFESRAILSKDLADELEVTIFDVISTSELKLVVVGIYDPAVLSLIDLDGRWLLPVDPIISLDLALKQVPYELEPFPLRAQNVIILPWKAALRLGGFISSVSLVAKEDMSKADLGRYAGEIAYSTEVTSNFAHAGKSYSMTRLVTFEMLGWSMALIPLVLVCFSIVNFMLGIIMARKREISTYSSVGLSPSGALVMFSTEALTYALGGALLGYLLGWGMNVVSLSLGLLPETFGFNFVSGFVVISISLIVGATLAASLYPLKLASRLVTPSLERKWRMPTRPSGSHWEIPLPIRAQRDECEGILAFLHEYFQGYGYERPNYKVQEILGIDSKNLSLKLKVLLMPVEHNIVQNVDLMAVAAEGAYAFFVLTDLLSGDLKIWKERNYNFIDDLRKQLLLWRSLKPEEQKRYIGETRQAGQPSN